MATRALSSAVFHRPAVGRRRESGQRLLADPATQRLQDELELADRSGEVAFLVVLARLVQLVADLVGTRGRGQGASDRDGEEQAAGSA